jgi:hypothetical protein
MTNSIPDSYLRLWQLAIKEAKRRNTTPEQVFDTDCMGLMLMYPPRMDDGAKYYCTPVNASVFGRTGGNGIHFSMLHVDHQVRDESPIVMTMPMHFDQPNWILGANLFEFLALGCTMGFFQLEQIAYKKLKYNNPQKYPVSFDDFDLLTENVEEATERRKLAQLMIDKLELQPWNDLEARLNELEQAYYPLIRLKPR